jgi:UDP-N-acetylglucosamine enolpyruvyl transferase
MRAIISIRNFKNIRIGVRSVEKIVVNGGIPLNGEIEVSGAKNAAVAIIPAVLLCDGICRIENVPAISDVNVIVRILYELGADVKVINNTTVEIDPRRINSYTLSADKVYEFICLGSISTVLLLITLTSAPSS